MFDQFGNFQTVGAAKWNAFRDYSKRKSGTASSSMLVASSSMLVDRVVRSDVPRCNSSHKSGGCPVVSARCVSIAIVYCMRWTTGGQWRYLNDGSADERLGALSVIQARLFWTICDFCKFFLQRFYTAVSCSNPAEILRCNTRRS